MTEAMDSKNRTTCRFCLNTLSQPKFPVKKNSGDGGGRQRLYTYKEM